MKKILSILFFAIIVIVLTACTAAKGSILIKENITGTGCEIEFVDWSKENKCELSLNKNDEILVEVACERGSVALDIRNKLDVEAYSGNGLDKAKFTVKAPEEGEYVISIKGSSATGSINIKNLTK